MADIIKITSSLLQRIFSNIKRELNNKANTDEVVLIDHIGQPDWVAPLDINGRVPRENLPVMGAVQEFRMGVASTMIESSATKWDYIVFDNSRHRFVAHTEDGKYYGNWIDSADYMNISTMKPRTDRLFVDNDNSKFYRWNGNSLVECCQPVTLEWIEASKGNFGGRPMYGNTLRDYASCILKAYKGVTVGDYTKWMIVFNTVTVDTTIRFEKSSHSNSYYAPLFTCRADAFNAVELWLPTSEKVTLLTS